MSNPTAPLELRVASCYRWRIAALLFAATTINYIDRGLLGVLAPTLQYRVFHWSDSDFAAINMAFKLAYAIGLVGAGVLIDRWGVRLGYLISVIVWASFGVLHTLIRPSFGLSGFLVARFGLGLGEAGNFPAAIKAVATWFPAKERALATGLFNAGSNVGVILAPLIVSQLVRPSGEGWQRAFLVTGSFSALWCLAWLASYGDPELHPKVNPAELEWIRSDTSQAPVTAGRPSWRDMLREPITWELSLLRLADAAWWFYLFWGGKFLFDQFGLDIKGLALPLVFIYVLADLGSVAGGWASSRLIQAGWPVVHARKSVMLGCALLILPVASVTRLDTRFEVDPSFFDRLGQAGVVLSPQQVAAMNRLHGQQFTSARQFVAAVEKASANVPLSMSVEAMCVAAARSNQLYWLATLLIALAAAGHQAWAANLFTLIGDYVPRHSVASVTGFGGMVGALAGIMADFFLGQLLTDRDAAGYFAAFVGAATVYLVVLGLFHLVAPARASA